MDVTYDEKSKCFKLDTENTSYVVCIADEEGFAGHAYYGKKIRDADVSYLLRTGEPPFVPSKNARERGSFLDSFPMEYPGTGCGDYREGAIQVLDDNGHFAVSPCYEGHRIFDGKPPIPGLPATFAGEGEAKTLELSLRDDAVGLRMILCYSVFSDVDAISRSVCIENVGERDIFLTKALSLSMDMEDRGYEMLSLHGSWARERQMEFRKIGHGKQSIGSTRGETSHQAQPFLALIAPGASQEDGEVYAFHFCYSGNFLAQIEKDQFDSLRVLMGIHPQDFRWKLRPGEHFYAPEAICAYSERGLGGMTRALHDLYRKHLIRSPYLDRERPVLINNWEATYFDFDAEKLLSIAREAKKCGIEMLVMDDGWFGRRDDDGTSLGDWRVNEEKIRGGLPNLVREVNRIGLKFGIWFEPEMVSPDSDLYRAHPEWAIALPGREPCRSRNQYVLDLSREDVREYCYESVASILRSANIEYVKWDMNRQLADLGSAALETERQGELSHRYVLGVYELQERLLSEFPNLLLENCSGGGGRFDPGMLYYSPQIWCSDDTDAIERLAIQEGTALLYPLSAIGAHVSACPNHATGRTIPFETRANVALAGTFGYELDITKIPPGEREMIPEQIAMRHRFHPLISRGDYYRVASYRENGNYDCYGVVSKDKKEALFTYVQVLARPNARSRNVRLRGLDEDAVYRVESEGGEPLLGECEGRLLSGGALMHAGIPIPNMMGDFRSVLIHLSGDRVSA